MYSVPSPRWHYILHDFRTRNPRDERRQPCFHTTPQSSEGHRETLVFTCFNLHGNLNKRNVTEKQQQQQQNVSYIYISIILACPKLQGFECKRHQSMGINTQTPDYKPDQPACCSAKPNIQLFV